MQLTSTQHRVFLFIQNRHSAGQAPGTCRGPMDSPWLARHLRTWQLGDHLGCKDKERHSDLKGYVGSRKENLSFI